MAKLKKLPKAPKASSNVDTWKKYEKRLDEVMKFNNEVKRQKEQKAKMIDKIKAKKSKA
jgi:hypothetical protein